MQREKGTVQKSPAVLAWEQNIQDLAVSGSGEADYEADVLSRPLYHDGAPRKQWEQLSSIEQWSWNRKYRG